MSTRCEAGGGAAELEASAFEALGLRALAWTTASHWGQWQRNRAEEILGGKNTVESNRMLQTPGRCDQSKFAFSYVLGMTDLHTPQASMLPGALQEDVDGRCRALDL